MSGYYLYKGEKFVGPFTKSDLIGKVASGEINGADTCMSSVCNEVNTVQDALDQPGTAQINFRSLKHSVNARPSAPKVTRIRGVYIILGLLFGCYGFHDFYAGYYASGCGKIIITVVGVALFISGETLGLFLVGATGLWALIDIFATTEDATGSPMA